ncbi:MAG: diguanylate cyclase [Clostridiales bacterium]|nr:diguanylate cyclase [Clostridiales bacterium]
MKKALAIILVFLLLPLAGCSHGTSKAPLTDMIKTYRDVPGVTEKEIAEIEELKANRGAFTYGALLSTEAFTLPDGSTAGFAVNLCDFLSEFFGARFNLELFEWDELINGLESRSIDFAGELTATEERMQVYGMTLPIAERLLRIFTRADSEIQDEADVSGMRIGFLEGSITADTIKKSYPVNFVRIDISEYPIAAKMIEDGEIDAFIDEAVADPAFDEYDFINSKIFFSRVHESVSMATANPDLAPVVSVIDKFIDAGGVDKLYELYKDGDFEYTKFKLHKAFNAEEKKYLDNLTQSGASVSVIYEQDNYPVNFYNKNDGEFEGIAVDVLEEISKLTDIAFEAAPTNGEIWAEMFEKIKTGELPMAAQMLYSKAREDLFLWSAVPYSKSYYIIMSRSDYPNLASYQIVRARVGVLKQSGLEDIYKELFPDNDNLVRYDTLNECLDALENGDVDLLMASEHTLLYQINYREKPGFKVNIELNAPMDSYFGFFKGEGILCSIIDKAQQFVQTDAIEASWTGRMFDYSKKIAEDRARLMMIFVAVLLCLLIATGLLFLRNLRLGRKLKEMANNDALTGIFNRRFFMELSAVQIARSLRTGIDCFIIIFDLDHFKVVNDTYGHVAGDEVLREISRRVRSCIRPYDIFGRYGGEEFIILMTDIKGADRNHAISAVERIRLEVCNTPVMFEGKEISISASFGIANAAPKNDLDLAVRYADEALYMAKEEGRNKVVFYDGASWATGRRENERNH